ncbi:MAG: N-acetylmuramic acid 6-phosphate phosphatase MupP [Methylomicrobium sp.]
MTMRAEFKLSCVLFDLDGTLVDTAPDLIACLNDALLYHGFASVSADRVRPFISHGASAMVAASCGDAVDEATRKVLVTTMLDLYQQNIAQHTVYFDGMPQLLEAIEAQGLKWGVVTNKLTRFTEPLMRALDLTRRAACIVSGDTTGKSKPHPEPMFEGCRQAGVEAHECVYIGDASHDIAAGKSAGMKTLAALYGYLKPEDTPETWGADALIEHPSQIDTWIKTTLCN